MELRKGTRRFLVIWISIQILALLINFAKLDWSFQIQNSKEFTVKPNDYAIRGYKSEKTKTKTYYMIYYFTSDGMDYKNSGFWPFVKFYSETKKQNFDFKYDSNNILGELVRYNYESIDGCFKGIFYKYDYTEFAFYCLLPFIIIGFKKWWN